MLQASVAESDLCFPNWVPPCRADPDLAWTPAQHFKSREKEKDKRNPRKKAKDTWVIYKSICPQHSHGQPSCHLVCQQSHNFCTKICKAFLMTDNKFPHLLCNTMCRKKYRSYNTAALGNVHLQSAVSESNYRSSLHFRFIELSSQQCK